MYAYAQGGSQGPPHYATAATNAYLPATHHPGYPPYHAGPSTPPSTITSYNNVAGPSSLLGHHYGSPHHHMPPPPPPMGSAGSAVGGSVVSHTALSLIHI